MTVVIPRATSSSPGPPRLWLPMIEDATAEDVRPLMRLMSAAVPDCSAQTVWAVPWSWSSYRVIRGPFDEPIACAALDDVDPDLAEIRGVVVDKHFRGQGLATLVVRDAVDDAVRRGRTPVCITRHPSLFRRLGFVETSPQWLSAQRHVAIATDPPRIALKFHRPT